MDQQLQPDEAEARPAATRKQRFVMFAASTAPQGVVSSLASLAALLFLGGPIRLGALDIDLVMAIALVAAAPTYALAGWLSDKIGARRVMLGGALLCLVAVYPAFAAIERLATPALVQFRASTPITVTARDCHARIFVTLASQPSACDRAKDFLAHAGLSFTSEPADPSQPDVVVTLAGYDIAGFEPAAYKAELASLGYPKLAPLTLPAKLALAAVLAVLFAAAGVISGALSAYLTQRFAPQARRSSVSFAFPVGGGVFGGFLPLIVSALIGLAT